MVALPDGETGSAFFHRVLSTAAKEFGLPSLGPKGQFKKRYGDLLVRFEGARVASPQRVQIARKLTNDMFASLRLGHDALLDGLQKPGVPKPMQTLSTSASGPIEVPFEGRVFRGGKEIAGLVDKLHQDHHMSSAAHTALRWTCERELDLHGHRFVLMGAGAELSPVQMLLNAGAEVLWIDVKPPQGLVGKLTFSDGDDLLGDPLAVMAQVRQFAERGPVHLGLLAYAPGQSRELRIAAVMAGMARVLGPELVRSVSMLISPTSPGIVQPEDRQTPEMRPLWQRALAMAHVLPQPGRYGDASRAIVALQGPGYQAAQYLAKIAFAEATDNMTVSANVAGITNTRSLAHPLFQLAFAGAPAFGVRIFEAGTTRALSGLLMLHDVLNTTRVTPEVLRSKQIHGGVYAMPWQFDMSVKTAALIGAATHPGLLFGAKAGSARPAAAPALHGSV